MVVQLNETVAMNDWSYNDDSLEGSGTDEAFDFKIFNRASVQVGAMVKVEGDDGTDEYVPEFDEPHITETVENPVGSMIDFPATGGMGTDLFMIVGGLILLAALPVCYFLYNDERRKKKYC